MEYDKWGAKDGLIIESEFISKIRSEGFQHGVAYYETAEKSGLQPVYYDGELINLAWELLDKTRRRVS